MKRFLLLTTALLVLMLIVTVTPANPIKAIYLSELLFDKDGGWRMELIAQNYDGWYIKTKTDSALFKDGFLHTTSNLRVISNDSLKKSLYINPQGDSISIFSPGGLGFPHDVLTFGKEDWKNVSAPRYGQSICQNQQGYYLDNTPTLGTANDISNTEGTIQFQVQDSLGHPVTAATIVYYLAYDPGRACGTNSSGVASATMIARRMWFYVSATGFMSTKIWTQSYPESTITVPVTLSHAPDAVETFGIISPGSFMLNNPYPNPFNPEVMLEYTLPRNGPVDISVYDVSGKLVSEIFSGKQSAGKNVARWEATSYPSGVYLIRVKTSDGMALKKCLLLK